jgi:NAD(P)-dependent dehydrogenase (short-subunit alcohol dehydrogenase family)
LHGNPGQANYSTAKMGIVGLTKTIAKEWGPFGIRCNAIAFGTIDTRLTRDKVLTSFHLLLIFFFVDFLSLHKYPTF